MHDYDIEDPNYDIGTMSNVRAVFHKLRSKETYPNTPPYDPDQIYPELQRVYPEGFSVDPHNHVYSAVRSLLIRLGFDLERQGTKEWNPLGDIVKPGENVLIKPNFVLHPQIENGGDTSALVTHPSVLRVLVDYALLAVGKDGRVTIGDTPLEECDFKALCDATGTGDFVARTIGRGHKNLELIDFRTFETRKFPGGRIEKRALTGDPRGYSFIDLGRNSLHQDLEDKQGPQNYYTLADRTIDHSDPASRESGMPNRHHSDGKHGYNIANTVLEASLIIDAAKLKTHKFAGVSLCLKNMVGICEGKEYLPHRRPGSLDDGGDSYPTYPSRAFRARMTARRLKRAAIRMMNSKTYDFLRSVIRSSLSPRIQHKSSWEPVVGDWYGNDTLWRTILDLNLIMLHANKSGVNFSSRSRRFLGIIDGVVGQDHDGPISGKAVRSRVLIASTDPVAADSLGAILMGFAPWKIPTIANVNRPICEALGSPIIGNESFLGNVTIEEAVTSFVPPMGWREQ